MKNKNYVRVGTALVVLLSSYTLQAFGQTTNPQSKDYPELITLSPEKTGTDIPSSISKRGNITSFVSTVIDEHPALKAAAASLDAERARARGLGRKLYNPELELEFETADTETATIGLSQTLDRHGKRGARDRAGKDNILVAKAAYALVRKTLETELLIALADYQNRVEQVDLAKKKVEFGRNFLLLAQRREAAGDLSKSDVLTAQLALSSAKAGLTIARADLSRSDQALISLSGQSLSTWPLLKGTPNGSYSKNWRAIPDQLPEVQLALAQSRASHSMVSVAQKMRKTDPTIGGRIGSEGSNILFGVRLAIPLQINNNYSDSVDAAKAESVHAAAGLERVRRQAIARLNGTRRRLEAAEQAWQNWQNTGAEQLEKQRSLLKRLWEAGELGATQYLIQYNQTFEAQKASTDLKSAYWRSWFEYLDASYTIPKWLEAIK
ncbi:MAG TPA: TolC family protein [Gammaproteobacteria bacterium]|nr:TolC family protein [Gammaproteobacteria bacterium]